MTLMLIPFILVTHCKKHEDKKEHEEKRYNLPHEDSARAFMDEEGYAEYINKHGYHFTEALAEHLSREMVNADGTAHTWTSAEVREAMASLGETMPPETTLGDITYLANMYYADLYPTPLSDETACIMAALKTAADPDGYKGMAFIRWTADAIGKHLKIKWSNYL